MPIEAVTTAPDNADSKPLRILLPLILTSLPAIAAAQDYFSGADLSFASRYTQAGVEYYDENSQPDGAIAIASAAGLDTIRLRLFVDPADGFSNLDDVRQLAEHAAAQNLRLFLALHLSDTWADPSQQDKPVAWTDLDFETLQSRLYDYSANVIATLAAAGVTPAMVQIGNETSAGMLWPDGMLSPGTNPGWSNFADLVAAAIAGVRDATPAGERIDIALHIDNGADNALSRWFFDHATEEGLDFDLIGVSYYPWWHGTLEQLETNLTDLAQRYGFGIVVVETAYPWTLDVADDTNNIVGLESQLLDGYPATPEGQRDFIAALQALLLRLPDGAGRGMLYWSPDRVSAGALESDWENLALFDFDHQALPGMKSLPLAQPEPEPEPEPEPDPAPAPTPEPAPDNGGGSGSGGGSVLWLLVALGVSRFWRRATAS